MLKEMELTEILSLVSRHLNLWVLPKICVRYAWKIFLIHALIMPNIWLRYNISLRYAWDKPLICMRQNDCFVNKWQLTFYEKFSKSIPKQTTFDSMISLESEEITAYV